MSNIPGIQSIMELMNSLYPALLRQRDGAMDDTSDSALEKKTNGNANNRTDDSADLKRILGLKNHH